jgi:hypothetical protein
VLSLSLLEMPAGKGNDADDDGGGDGDGAGEEAGAGLGETPSSSSTRVKVMKEGERRRAGRRDSEMERALTKGSELAHPEPRRWLMRRVLAVLATSVDKGRERRRCEQ